MAVRSIQVLLGSGATQVQPPSSNPERQVQCLIFSNNTGSAVRVGDKTVSATVGIVLPAATPVTIAPAEAYGMFLSEFWLFGTAATSVDILYVE